MLNQIFSVPFRGVTRHLIIINVLMFFGTTLLMSEHREINEATGMIDQHRMWLASFFPTSPYFRSWQIVTHMFMHANLQHLLFNMFSLYMFGSMVEMVWGERRFLFFYLFCGLGAWALHMGVTAWEIQKAPLDEIMFLRDVPVLGASGAIYGVMAGFALLFPTQTIQLLFPPIPIQARYFVLGLAAIDLYSGISGSGAGVAHFAHVGGALFGAILYFFWNRKSPKMGW
jgi:membrane associated rhomboid family serine protease